MVPQLEKVDDHLTYYPHQISDNKLKNVNKFLPKINLSKQCSPNFLSKKRDVNRPTQSRNIYVPKISPLEPRYLK